MKIEIPISKVSEQYIKDTLSRYIEIEDMPKQITGRCIFHMYPYQDTTDENGGLVGYQDAILFNLHIYDIDNMTVWKTSNKDSLDIDVPCKTRIFKDLSTMVVIDGGVKLHSFQAFEVCRIGKYNRA